MREALAQARSPAGSVRSGALAFAGSRTAQAQKARRRPVFQQRQSSPGLRTPRSRPRSRHSADLSAAAPMPSYIASSTMRKLTSARWAVRKEAFTGARQDGSRLLKQIQKQLLFSAQCRTGGSVNDAVSTPEVYGLASTQHDAAAAASRLSVDMEYIPFNDVRHVMLEKDRATNEWLVTTAIGLIDGNLALSTAVPLSDHWPAFQQKADSIKQAVAKSALLSADERLAAVAQINHLLDHYSLPAAQRAMIPLGPCHGDLTLTNMLVDTENRELCVFDFLDCFVVSRPRPCPRPRRCRCFPV